MIKYTGTKCIVCDEKFKDEDDVVVCPQCGTPYHRECYKKEEKCINTALHESGKAWKPEHEPVSDVIEKADRVCKSCGYENPEGTMYCEIEYRTDTHHHKRSCSNNRFKNSCGFFILAHWYPPFADIKELYHFTVIISIINKRFLRLNCDKKMKLCVMPCYLS